MDVTTRWKSCLWWGKNATTDDGVLFIGKVIQSTIPRPCRNLTQLRWSITLCLRLASQHIRTQPRCSEPFNKYTPVRPGSLINYTLDLSSVHSIVPARPQALPRPQPQAEFFVERQVHPKMHSLAIFVKTFVLVMIGNQAGHCSFNILSQPRSGREVPACNSSQQNRRTLC